MKKYIFIIVMAGLLSSLFSFTKGGSESFIIQNNSEFANTIKTESDLQLVDVRTPQEFKESHIPGAINIDVKNPDFINNIKVLDKSKPVAVYCRSGMRSKNAAEILVKDGYKVYELNKGFMNWDGDKTSEE